MMIPREYLYQPVPLPVHKLSHSLLLKQQQRKNIISQPPHDVEFNHTNTSTNISIRISSSMSPSVC